MNVIEINKLTKYYGKSRGIIDLSFNVEQTEIFGFIGPNGAGKSTTIRTLLGLIKPTSGSATIFGKDIVTQSTEIKRHVGYLPSEVFYYEGMRAIDLLRYSDSFYGGNCEPRMKMLADRFDLDLKRKIDDLSYGNKKKVGIIQGLLHEPQLIILDEPTGGLDPLMQQIFFDTLAEENKRGATILFSSHILSEVQRMCNRVAIVKEGKLIKLESVAGLKASAYKKVRLVCNGKGTAGIEKMKGVMNFHHEGENTEFLYNGTVKPLMCQLAELELHDVEIIEPDLEEIFLHFYKKEG